MNRIVRAIALSGAAAAAVMATATTASADTPEAAETAIQSAVDRAAGAPVTLPSGKKLHVRGLDSVAYRADASHRTAVVQLAADQPGSNMTTFDQPGFSPQQVQQPQVQTQAGGGALGTGAVIALVLGVVLFFGLKANRVTKGWAFTCIAMGVVLSGTFIGPLIQQLGGSGVQAFGNLFAGL